MSYETDIVVCLDEPTHVEEDYQHQKLSVERTISWAKRAVGNLTAWWSKRG